MSSEIKSFFRGEPKRAEELLGKQKHYPWETWEEILKAIDEGTGREVIMSYATCKKAIKELEGFGKIKKGEYQAVIKTPREGKRKVFIIHRATKK